jgi:hypothetical protein
MAMWRAPPFTEPLHEHRGGENTNARNIFVASDFPLRAGSVSRPARSIAPASNGVHATSRPWGRRNAPQSLSLLPHERRIPQHFRRAAPRARSSECATRRNPPFSGSQVVRRQRALLRAREFGVSSDKHGPAQNRALESWRFVLMPTIAAL